jgi:tetratricopeptide (TPR) repeat protein
MRRLLLALCLVNAALSQQTLPQPAHDQLLRRAVELHQAGDIPGAIAAYREFLKVEPRGGMTVMALSNLGAALSRSGQYELAIAEYQKALKLDSRNLPIRLNLALAYYKTSQISEAAEELESVIREQPTNRQAVFLLADCDLRLGENKKVIGLLTPLEKDSLKDGQGSDKALSYLLGTALIRDNQTARGQQVVDRILREGESAEAHLLLGTTKMNAQEFSEALVDLKKAVELNPQLPDVYSYYGLALLTTGDMAAAANAFRKELETNPYDFVSNLQLGVIFKQDQRYEDARASFERALRVRPGDAGVRYQMATLDLTNGDLAAACTKLEQLIEEAPQFVEAHVSLATVYYRLKRKEDGDRERTLVLKLNADAQAGQPGVKAK